ncbi:HAMP domain-containing sensor histidine kinase [Terracoccus sp. 273MFTsu3.1]|uniref:HAMP domain-containing sensor histidine kinase n=1 Tax=Terracoccus sp. 273MFTsu3.1 TaxID=1172188 RepID=UPI0006852FC8|nr:HAMP domain-containing sensor histidine kinase [Terracoccus sp. 273MFTsu3.1]
MVRTPRPDAPRSRWATRSLGTRLMVAQGTVVTAGILTASTVAALIGPPLFHEHLLRAGMSATASELEHVEQAYNEASFVSLGVALVIAVLCALGVTWYVAGRLTRPLAALTTAAHEMGQGNYAARAAVSDAGPELASLAEAFNGMAGRLGDAERTRRRLVGDVAHEMRTPVATLAAYLDGLDDKVVEWDESTAALFRSNIERLTRLCDDMSAVSRAEEGHLELRRCSVPVREVIESAEREARPGFTAKGVWLELGSCVDARVVADAERVGQVLTNLLTNALRHTPAGGEVIMSAARAGADVQLVVQDTGEGLAPDQLTHVFERFYRGDAARTRDARGSGVGLTIAKAIAEAHGGRLTVTSPGSGHGATFTLSLPVAG